MNVSPSFSQTAIVVVRGACTPSRTRRLYRPAGHSSSVTTLLPYGRAGPVPPLAGVVCNGPASIVCTDLAGRSFQLLTCRCVGTRGLYPLPRASSVPTLRGALPAAVRVRGACTPFRECRLYRPRGTLVSVQHLQLRERVGPVPLSAVSSVPTRGTLIQVLNSVAACARGTCPLFGPPLLLTTGNPFGGEIV